MREIKFRAWDNGKMQVVGFNNLSENRHHPSGHIYIREEMKPFGESHKTILMQYTGLKVHDEKELFEGDIVPVKVSIHHGWKQGWRYFTRNAVVEYVDKEMRFMFATNIEGYGKKYVHFDRSVRQSYKIIGNIYENPELLDS